MIIQEDHSGDILECVIMFLLLLFVLMLLPGGF